MRAVYAAGVDAIPADRVEAMGLNTVVVHSDSLDGTTRVGLASALHRRALLMHVYSRPPATGVLADSRAALLASLPELLGGEDVSGGLGVDGLLLDVDWFADEAGPAYLVELTREVERVSRTCLVGLVCDADVTGVAGLDLSRVDYVSPRLFMGVADPDASMVDAFAAWQARAGEDGPAVWPVLATHRTLEPGSGFNGQEIAYQIGWLRRGSLNERGGHIHSGLSTLLADVGGLASLLEETAYARGAVVPETTQRTRFEVLRKRLDPPRVRVLATSGPVVRVGLDAESVDEDAYAWAVQVQRDGQWAFGVYPVGRTQADVRMPSGVGAPDRVVVCVLDRLGRRSVKVLARPE